MEELLYHYTSNQKGFNILKNKEIWMSDIRKSNDKDETLMLYPDVVEKMIMLALQRYGHDQELNEYLNETKMSINNWLMMGCMSFFVLCFSKEPNLLSQWRAYADDGKGICIGFSSEVSGIRNATPVKYIDEDERQRLICEYAEAILDREAYTIHPHDENQIMVNVEMLMSGSLVYKHKWFGEEKECRIIHYLNKVASKYMDCNIHYHIKDDDIIPYIPLEFDNSAIREIWLGPKSKISEYDLDLFLRLNGYKNISIKRSGISYQ